MNDISNRTLVILAGIATFFSLFGTFAILSMLGIPSVPLITGFAVNQSAYVNVTVASTTSIVLIEGGNVSFGNGSAPAALSTASGTDNPNTFDDAAATADSNDFVIENDGNVDVNLTINGSRASLFITSGTGPAYNWSGANHSNTGDHGCYNITVGSLNGLTSPNTAQNAFGVGAINLSVCSNLSFVNTNDTVNVTIRVFIPGDTLPGTYTDSKIFFMACKTPCN